MLCPERWSVGGVLVARWLYVGIFIFSSVDPLGVGIRNADIVVFCAVVGGCYGAMRSDKKRHE